MRAELAGFSYILQSTHALRILFAVLTMRSLSAAPTTIHTRIYESNNFLLPLLIYVQRHVPKCVICV